jgi:CBS domain-containing protein
VKIALVASRGSRDPSVVPETLPAPPLIADGSTPAGGSTPRFGDALVRDAVRSPPVTCPPDTPMDEVADLMAAHRIDAVVVSGLGGVEPWGVVTDRNLLAVASDATARLAGSCATGRLLTIAPDEPLEAAVRLMRSHRVSHLMVIDPDSGSPIGVLATLDIARVVAGDRSYRASSPAR